MVVDVAPATYLDNRNNMNRCAFHYTTIIIIIIITTKLWTHLASLDALDDEEDALGRELARAVEVDGTGDGFAGHVHGLIRADKAVIACAEAGSHGGEVG